MITAFPKIAGAVTIGPGDVYQQPSTVSLQSVEVNLLSGGAIIARSDGRRTWFLGGDFTVSGGSVYGPIMFDNFQSMEISGGTFNDRVTIDRLRTLGTLEISGGTFNDRLTIDRLGTLGTLEISGGSFSNSLGISRFQGDVIVSGGSINSISGSPSFSGGAVPTATFVGTDWTLNGVPLVFTANESDLTGQTGYLRGTLADGNTFVMRIDSRFNPSKITVVDIADPIILPVAGNFSIFAGDAGETSVVEGLATSPFGSFSQTVQSDFASSQFSLDLTTNGNSSALIAMTTLMDIDPGGSESGLSFAIQFDLLQESTYEIFGGTSGSFNGTPDEHVQIRAGVQFNDLNPWDLLFFEEDNSLDASPVNFAMNGVNEGNISGNLPGEGSSTGILAPGRYGFDGSTWIFSRLGGFSAIGITDLSIRLTPTGNIPGSEPPTAEAGANQSIHAGDPVNLDGSGSSDDLTPTEDLLYSWSFDSVPVGSSLSTLNGASTISPDFTPDLPGQYVIVLVVTDENGLNSDPDTVTVSSLNVPPVADAGFDQGAIVGDVVILDGSASSDADLDPFNFAWTLVNTPAGSGASLFYPDTISPYFVPDLPGVYAARLVVNDGIANSTPDEITITVITAEYFAEINAIDAISAISVLPPDSVTTKGNQTALSQHISQVIVALQADDIQEALIKLEQAIERTDGCALRGAPDTGKGQGPKPRKDYITDCASQDSVYAFLADAFAALTR